MVSRVLVATSDLQSGAELGPRWSPVARSDLARAGIAPRSHGPVLAVGQRIANPDLKDSGLGWLRDFAGEIPNALARLVESDRARALFVHYQRDLSGQFMGFEASPTDLATLAAPGFPLLLAFRNGSSPSPSKPDFEIDAFGPAGRQPEFCSARLHIHGPDRHPWQKGHRGTLLPAELSKVLGLAGAVERPPAARWTGDAPIQRGNVGYWSFRTGSIEKSRSPEDHLALLLRTIHPMQETLRDYIGGRDLSAGVSLYMGGPDQLVRFRIAPAILSSLADLDIDFTVAVNIGH